jgi:flagellar hook-length control protein FliK
MLTNDIYSRLLAGESSDDIAAEMTKALNEALDRIEEEEKARKEAELKAAQDKAAKEAEEAHNKAKMDAAKDITTDVLTFCATYYPSFGLTLDDNVTDEEIEALAALIIMLLDLEAMKPRKKKAFGDSLFSATKLPVDIELKNEPKKPMTTDEVFAEAFKMLGL